jgi:hypothetical protein
MVNALSLKCVAMNAIISLTSALLVSLVVVAPIRGQDADRATRARGVRQRAKPGEIITAPDSSERWRDQLRIGEVAPEFTLPLASRTSEAIALARGDKQSTGHKSKAAKTKATQKTVSLKDLRAKKPVVLIFGSVTCPPFRRALDGIDNVYRDFHDGAEFLFVYIREAHPDSVLSLIDDKLAINLKNIPQAVTIKERNEAAVACGCTLSLNMPIAVDSIDNKVGRAYAGWPNRMVVVGTNGNILFASDPSPRGTDAARLRDWLKENLKN